MTTTSPESRMSYLSLALVSQRIVDALLKFVEEDQHHAELEFAIGEVLSGLKAASVQDTHQVGAGSSRAFATYQHVRTVEEVWSANDLASVISSLERLMDTSIPLEAKKASAEKLVDSFFDLETRALWNFNKPGNRVPQRVRELCQMP